MSPPDNRLQLVRVFTDEHGRFGNRLGIGHLAADADAAALATAGVAARLPETVVVADDRRHVRIFGHDGAEMTFAGHPLIGAAASIRQYSRQGVLEPPAGEVPWWTDDDGVCWISAPAQWGPDVTLIHYRNAFEIMALRGAPAAVDFAYSWAWVDEPGGVVRARAFAPGHGVDEDEATGGAALRLAAHLGRELTIVQGAGSVIFARLGSDGRVHLGGNVVADGQDGQG